MLYTRGFMFTDFYVGIWLYTYYIHTHTYICVCIYNVYFQSESQFYIHMNFKLNSWFSGEGAIPVAARSMAWVCGRWLTGIAGSNPPEDVCLVHESRTETDLCVCVCVCVSLSVIRRNSHPLNVQWVGRRGPTEKKSHEGIVISLCSCLTRRDSYRLEIRSMHQANRGG